MSVRTAAITIDRPRAEVESLWASPEYRHDHVDELEGQVSFADAPGDRGTEVRVAIDADPPAGKLGEAAQKLAGTEPLAKVKDDLRRFKQKVETGEIARSDATPDGERLGAKLDQRPAQPLADAERREMSV